MPRGPTAALRRIAASLISRPLFDGRVAMALLVTVSLAAAPLLGSACALSAQGLPSLYEPGISPDGSEIAFVSAGDIWTVSAEGGAARLLVAHSAHESRPLYSPDGSMLAFNSNRNGGLDIFVMDLESGEFRRLTHDSGSQQLNGWSADSEWVYFSSGVEDVGGMHDIFRVRASGGTPMAVSADRYETEFFAAPAPDGQRLAIASRGRMAQSQWWRNGHSKIDESEIWLVDEAMSSDEVPTFTRLTAGGKNLWPMWSAEGDEVWFMSDRSGAENLWRARVGEGDTEPITDFREGRLLWPSMSADGSTIAFERDFGIWVLDVESREARPLEIRLLGAIEGPAPELQEASSGWGNITVSPDGEKWAFTAGGEVWATTMEGDVPATRVTRSPAEQGQPVWSPESNQILYTSWETGLPKIRAWDFIAETERSITTGEGSDVALSFSPDGAWLAWVRFVDERRELHVRNWETGEERRLATGIVGGAAWSPDSRWIAYGAETDAFSNVMVVPVTGGEPRQVSFVASSFFGSIDWSADGSYIVYRTAQRTEPGQLVKIDMVPRTPTFDEARFRDLFDRPDEDPSPDTVEVEEREPPEERVREAVEVPDEIEIVFEGIRRRGEIVNTNFSVGQVLLSPDGETGVLTGDGALHRITFEPNGQIEITRLDFSGNPIAFNRDGSRLYLSSGGQLRVASMPGGQLRTVETSVSWDEDFEATRVTAFEQGWRHMKDGFYDPDFHGVDWDAVRDRFRPYLEGARTRAEFSRLMNLMLGELNASHLGHSGRTGPPGGGDGASTGRLGLRFDRHAVEQEGRFVVREVVELGPADIAGGIAVGDRILAVNGESLGEGVDLNRILRGTAGRRVVLRVDGGGEGPREVEVLAMTGGAESQLMYRNWVEDRRAYVDEISGGRLGYVHIASMSAAALDQFIFDLDQENHARDGVVVDVRNNNGGFVNVYAIDILARRNYFTMQSRGSDVLAPSRIRLGQRALLAPTVLVTNQHTLSDGEDFTEGYRELGLGTVVGEPTAGWIIFTGSQGLVDGTSVRMPSTFIRDNRGQNMELNPRPVDIEVERPTGEWYEGRDRQLERAVEVLLGQIDADG